MFYVQSTGLDHLLYSGRGAGGTWKGGEAAELRVACFMGLLSFLAGRLDVLRVSSTHTYRPLNAEARANVQSATITDTPLTDAGLDGTGQVIQVRLLLCSRTAGTRPGAPCYPNVALHGVIVIPHLMQIRRRRQLQQNCDAWLQ